VADAENEVKFDGVGSIKAIEADSILCGIGSTFASTLYERFSRSMASIVITEVNDILMSRIHVLLDSQNHKDMFRSCHEVDTGLYHA
jgi:hypothetical protein